MKEQCPKCGNWVEGKKVATFARKMTRGAVKKGSAVATGMAIGSIIPGAGTIIGGALGLAASALMDDSVNEVADLVEDIAFDETEYEFRCPKCGKIWKNNSNIYRNPNLIFNLKDDIGETLRYWHIHKEEMKNNFELYVSFIDAVAERGNSYLDIILKRFLENTNSSSEEAGWYFYEALFRWYMLYSNGVDSTQEYFKAKKCIESACRHFKTPESYLLQSAIYFEPAYKKVKHILLRSTIETINNNRKYLKSDDISFVLKKEVYETVYKHFDLYLENPSNFTSTYESFENVKIYFKEDDNCFFKGKQIQPYLNEEKEYLEEVKICLEEDNEISPRERRLLDRLRYKLNIPEERAKELEESLKAPQLTEDEQEYLEEYKLCLEEDGEISSKERRLLDRLRDKLGISVERAKELENIK